jgi:hypothetical protein
VTVTVFFFVVVDVVLATVKVDRMLVIVFVDSVAVLVWVTVTVDGVPAAWQELVVGFEVEELVEVVGFEEVDDILLDFDDEVEMDELVDFEEEVDETLLDFDDDVEELVVFEELDETLLDFDDEAELEVLVDLVDELDFELEVLVLIFLLEVVEIFEEVELDVLELTVDVAVHCPVDDGTALTPEPMGMILLPQLAA